MSTNLKLDVTEQIGNQFQARVAELMGEHQMGKAPKMSFEAASLQACREMGLVQAGEGSEEVPSEVMEDLSRDEEIYCLDIDEDDGGDLPMISLDEALENFDRDELGEMEMEGEMGARETLDEVFDEVFPVQPRRKGKRKK